MGRQADGSAPAAALILGGSGNTWQISDVLPSTSSIIEAQCALHLGKVMFLLCAFFPDFL